MMSKKQIASSRQALRQLHCQQRRRKNHQSGVHRSANSAVITNSITITDADGNTVYPGLSTSLSTYKLILFEMQGKAPIRLRFSRRGTYKLKISDKDTLNIDGNLPYDQEITNTPIPQGYAC